VNNIKLVKASSELLDIIKMYKNEFTSNNETSIYGSSGLHRAANYDEWLEEVIAKETRSIRGRVLATTYFLYRYEDKKIIGSAQLRHSLTDELKQHGGHIGYSISPLERRKGYAKQLLSLVLDEGRKIGLSEILLTCEANNVGSYKTMISCGGVLLDHNMFDGIEQKRFSIKLD